MTKIRRKPTRRALSAYAVIYSQWFYQIDSYIKEFIATPEVFTIDDEPAYADKVTGQNVDLRSLIDFNLDFFRIMNNREMTDEPIYLEPLYLLREHLSFDTPDELEYLDEEVLSELPDCLKSMRSSLNRLSLADAADIVLTIRIKDLV